MCTKIVQDIKKSDIHFLLPKLYTEHPERYFLTETPNTQTYAQKA